MIKKMIFSIVMLSGLWSNVEGRRKDLLARTKQTIPMTAPAPAAATESDFSKYPEQYLR